MKQSSSTSLNNRRSGLQLILIGLVIMSMTLLPISVQAGVRSVTRDPVWNAPTDGSPDWLKMAQMPSQLYSEYHFPLLAGRLINAGMVNSSDCLNSGLLADGKASDCGMQRAEIAENLWQNQFNLAIMNASRDSGVPPILMKNIFAWESNFWPRTIYVNTFEYGLGHLTLMGADSALRWNTPFYDSVCAANFSAATCTLRYADQPTNVQSALMGAVILQVNADCDSCANFLDISLASRSVPVFAHTLLANASFVKKYIKDRTGREAAGMASYEDLWKFTLASYNAGPGCFSNAFSLAYSRGLTLNWKNVSAQLEPACRSAVPYIDFISKTDAYFPGKDPAVMSTATPTPAPENSATPTAKALTTLTTPDTLGTPSPLGTQTPAANATATPEATPTAAVKPVQISRKENQIVLKIIDQGAVEVLQSLRGFGIDVNQDVEMIDSLSVLVVEINPKQKDDLLSAIRAIDGVEFAEPNHLVSMASISNDPLVDSQTNLSVIQAPQAWDVLPAMQEVVVAIIDTGVNFMHPDLGERLWQNAGELGRDVNGIDRRSNGIDDDANGYIDDWQGWNMIAGTNAVNDDQGHGTALAGVIGASTNNAIGIAGVAPNARLMPVKALDSTGFGTYAQVAEAITYATDMGAQVINLGFGGTGSSELLQNAVNYALARGVTVVAAAGNAGSSTIQFPAGYPGVLAVSAVDNSMYWAPFSSNGDHISLAAPGVNVYSTALNGQYSASSGTSLSAAHVSGVAALLAGQPAFANPNVLRSALLNTTINPNNNDFDQYFGYGVVQAYSALSYAGTILPTPTPWVVPTATPGGPGGVRIMATEDLWGLTQTSTYAQVNPANSIDSAFNDLVASSTGAYGAAAARNWTYTDIGDTTLTTIAAAYLDFRFYMTGWVNDTYYIDVYEPTNPFCGAFGWCRVATLQYTLVPANPTIIQPPSTLTTFTIPVGSILNTVSKVNNARVRITGSGITLDGAEIVTIHIDEIRLQVMDELPPTPTPSPTPVFIPTSTVPTGRAPTAMPDPNEPHSNFSPTTDQCGTCHRSHTAQGQQLRSTAAEEETCFSCHTGGGTGTNVQPAFTSRTNTLTRIFNHAVSATSNIHRSEEIVGFNFSGPNRHIECEDCHSPHSSARSAVPGANAAPSIQQEMFHSTGAMPEWTAPGAPTSFTWLSQSTREFEVCMKCHSSFTTLPTYAPDGFGWDGSSPIAGYISNGLNKLTSTNPAQVLDSRDMAKEFNSYQVSFHPVAALGRNTNMPAGSFVAPWSQNSILYCTDCHDYSAGSSDGPHGSALLHILDGTADYITKTDPLASCAPGGCPSIHNPGELCFKCHQYNTYATGMNPVTTTNFRTGTANMHAFHSFGSCYSCHDSHGSEQDRLINFDTAVVGVDLGYTSQSAWQFNGATGTGTCYISCHSGDHGADTSRQYTP